MIFYVYKKFFTYIIFRKRSILRIPKRSILRKNKKMRYFTYIIFFKIFDDQFYVFFRQKCSNLRIYIFY